MNLKELQELLKRLLTEARDIAARAEKEDRDFTAEERTKVAGLLEDAKKVKADIKTLQGDEEMRKAIAEFGDGIDFGANGTNGQPARKAGARFLETPQFDTLGQAFVGSKTWQEWLKQNAPGGVIPDSRKGISSPPLEFKHFGLFRKDLITGLSDTSAGAFVDTERTGIYEPLGRYPLVLRDLISVRQTMSDTVEFVRQTAQVTQAAAVPEANVTDYTGATGQVSGQKPEGSMAFERVTATVKTLAVWIPATKRALSDAAQLRGLIDDELRSDLAEELENQMLNGDGLGENLPGIDNTANTLVQPFATDLLTTTRKAITNLLVNGKSQPTAWVFNPMDWETIDLLKDGENRYYFGGPVQAGVRTLWGIPVVQSFFQPQGKAWLANWRKAVLWDREQASITVSDSHSDFFIRNMVAILAEMRAAFGVIRPSAFCEVDLEAGS